jgi:hypothetical protein
MSILKNFYKRLSHQINDFFLSFSNSVLQTNSLFLFYCKPRDRKVLSDKNDDKNNKSTHLNSLIGDNRRGGEHAIKHCNR